VVREVKKAGEMSIERWRRRERRLLWRLFAVRLLVISSTAIGLAVSYTPTVRLQMFLNAAQKASLQDI
jgi:hypothetical protein